MYDKCIKPEIQKKKKKENQKIWKNEECFVCSNLSKFFFFLFFTFWSTRFSDAFSGRYGYNLDHWLNMKSSQMTVEFKERTKRKKHEDCRNGGSKKKNEKRKQENEIVFFFSFLFLSMGKWNKQKITKSNEQHNKGP